MKLKFKACSALQPEERMIRETVFVQEQGFQEEFDETDRIAQHILGYDEEAGNAPVCCCRVFPGKTKDEYIIGRAAVLKPYRGKGIGSAMMNFTADHLRRQGAARIRLAAQVQAKGFYDTLGYQPDSDEFLEEGCPHVWMAKDL